MKKQLSLLANTLPLSFDDAGEGRPFLLLHGGAGPGSMAGLAGALAGFGRSILATHPGFNAQPRPDWFHRLDDLVLAYLALIERLDLQDVVVVGNSLGGWLAAELALRGSQRISAVVLLNAVGIEPNVETGEIADPLTLGPKIAGYAFHDPVRFALTPASPEAAAMMAANQKTLRVYSSEYFMFDPGLRGRLAQVAVPALFVWGESDRICTPAYGRQFSSLIPSSRFELIPKAGHFPQIEQLDAVTGLIREFVQS
jgi:pimeloyl-ACP methyl ester carboxylesterase